VLCFLIMEWGGEVTGAPRAPPRPRYDVPSFRARQSPWSASAMPM